MVNPPTHLHAPRVLQSQKQASERDHQTSHRLDLRCVVSQGNTGIATSPHRRFQCYVLRHERVMWCSLLQFLCEEEYRQNILIVTNDYNLASCPGVQYCGKFDSFLLD